MGRTMGYTWDMYGMHMGCVWDLYGMHNGMRMGCTMGCVWDVYGMHMGCVWDAHGMCMGCAMGRVWDAHGMCMGCVWDAHGMCMGRVCDAPWGGAERLTLSVPPQMIREWLESRTPGSASQPPPRTPRSSVQHFHRPGTAAVPSPHSPTAPQPHGVPTPGAPGWGALGFSHPRPFFRDRHDGAQHLQEAPHLQAERWGGG